MCHEDVLFVKLEFQLMILCKACHVSCEKARIGSSFMWDHILSLSNKGLGQVEECEFHLYRYSHRRLVSCHV